MAENITTETFSRRLDSEVIMNINSTGMYLVMTLAGVVSLALFIYLGSLLLEFFKTPVEPFENERDVITEALGSGETREKIMSEPTVIQALPIHQEGQREALLS